MGQPRAQLLWKHRPLHAAVQLVFCSHSFDSLVVHQPSTCLRLVKIVWFCWSVLQAAAAAYALWWLYATCTTPCFWQPQSTLDQRCKTMFCRCCTSGYIRRYKYITQAARCSASSCKRAPLAHTQLVCQVHHGHQHGMLAGTSQRPQVMPSACINSSTRKATCLCSQASL
jgi:hypothetical protein